MRKSLYRSEHDILTTLLREFRLRQGLTQTQVARALGAPQSFLSDVETGQRRLDLVQLRDLCQALGIPLVRLIHAFEKHIAQAEMKSETMKKTRSRGGHGPMQPDISPAPRNRSKRLP
jgi:transcriptional regulator with XRE-family HTH domain